MIDTLASARAMVLTMRPLSAPTVVDTCFGCPPTRPKSEARRLAARAEAMARKPPTPPQLSYLKALGHIGPPPANMLVASQRIDSLIKKGQP